MPSRRRIVLGLVVVAAAAVAIWVAGATVRETSNYPTWASPCGGIDPGPSADRVAAFTCAEARRDVIAHPPVIRHVDWIAVLGSGAIVLAVGGLVVDRLARRRFATPA